MIFIASLQFVLVHSLEVGQVLEQGVASGTGTYYVSDVAERFSAALQQIRARDAHRSLKEAEDLAQKRSIMEQASDPKDRELLEEAFEIQEENRMERQSAQGKAASFVAMLRQVMGNGAGAQSCQELTCGGNAFCETVGAESAMCKCKAGYEGDGLVCNPSASFTEHALIAVPAGSAAPQVSDLHVATLSDQAVAVAFRDVTRKNRGFLVLGKAYDGGMRWGPPALISDQSPAFGPVLAELADSPRGFALAYRTANRGGDALLCYGRRDGENRVQLGAPLTFAKYQAQGMALIALPQARVAVLFAEHVPVSSGKFDSFGSSLLAEFPADHGKGNAGLVVAKLLGKYRFATGAVSRLSAAPLSSKSFAVAYRQGKAQAQDSEQQSREATVSLAELWGPELVFTTQALTLEPSRGQIWARSVAGLGGNAFAYTYHSGAEQVTKQAIVRLDPQSHRLVLVQEPVTISAGFTPFVSTIGTVQQRREHQAPELVQLLQSQGHRLFTFLGGQGAKGQGRICGVTEGRPVGCKEVGTTQREVLGVAIAAVGDGRVFLLTIDAKGAPYYTLVGLMGNH